jgi:hypothetical protein
VEKTGKKKIEEKIKYHKTKEEKKEDKTLTDSGTGNLS